MEERFTINDMLWDICTWKTYCRKPMHKIEGAKVMIPMLQVIISLLRKSIQLRKLR